MHSKSGDNEEPGPGTDVTGMVRYIIHLYCLVVQAGFYSDVVECSTIDRKVPGSSFGREFFKSP